MYCGLVYEESLVSDIGRACLIRLHISLVGGNGFGINEREQQYLHIKSQPKNEKYANGSV